MMTNPGKITGVIFLNVMLPLMYLVAGMVVASVTTIEEGGYSNPGPIIAFYVSQRGRTVVFLWCARIPRTTNIPILPAAEPQTIGNYSAEEALSYSRGY
jgi:hypothetical protein